MAKAKQPIKKKVKAAAAGAGGTGLSAEIDSGSFIVAISGTDVCWIFSDMASAETGNQTWYWNSHPLTPTGSQTKTWVMRRDVYGILDLKAWSDHYYPLASYHAVHRVAHASPVP